MCIGVCLHRTVKGLENQLIVIPFADHVGHNAAVVEVQNCAEIDLVNLNAFIPLEFCYVGKPLLIRLVRMKVSIKQILSHKLRILCLSGAAVVAVLDGGLNAFGPADAEHPLVIDVDTVVMPQFVIDAPVALVRALRVNLLDLFRKRRVLYSTGTQFAGCPLIVCRARNTQ